MAKQTHPQKRPVKRSESEGSAGKDFVRAVQGLYHAIINKRGEPDIKIASLPEDDRTAAMSVASGFILLRQLLNREMERTDMVGPFEIYRALNAQEILDALIGDFNGPIRRYVAHLGLPQKLPANRTAALRRSSVVGFVFALEEASKRDGKKLTREQAILAVSESSGNFYTPNMIKGWIRHKTAPMAPAAAMDFLEQAHLLADQVDAAVPLRARVSMLGRQMIIASTPLSLGRAERAFVARKK